MAKEIQDFIKVLGFKDSDANSELLTGGVLKSNQYSLWNTIVQVCSELYAVLQNSKLRITQKF